MLLRILKNPAYVSFLSTNKYGYPQLLKGNRNGVKHKEYKHFHGKVLGLT